MSPILKSLARFFYVRCSDSAPMHRCYKSRYNPVEGDITECGRIITTKWHWVTPLKKRSRICLKCAAVPAPAKINVQRIRSAGESHATG